MRNHRTRTVALVSLLTASVLTACEGSAVLRSSSDSLGRLALLSDAKPGAGLDFGPIDCGADSNAGKTVTVKNDGEGPMRWSASLDSIAYFAIEGASEGTLEAGQSATLTVKAGVMPTSVEAGSVEKADLVITTDDPSHPAVHVPLAATAQGGTLELIAPAVADFGQTPLGVASTPIPVSLRNTGNAPLKVAVTSPTDTQFAFGWTGGDAPAEIAPGATMTGLNATFTAATAYVANSAGVIETTGAVCGVSAKAIPVKGQGLGGIVGVSPGTIDLGKVDCNTQGEPQVLTIYNSGNLVFTWKAALKDAENYTLSQAAGAVTPGNFFQLIVTPKALGMTKDLADNAFGDLVTVTTDVAGDVPHEVPVKQTASGAILKWTTVIPLAFGALPIGIASGEKFLTLINDGNVAAAVEVSGSTQFVGTSGSVPGGGGAFVSSVKYTPDTLGAQKAKIEITTAAPICQPLPTGIAATGSGKGTAAAISLGGPPRNRGNGQGGCILMANSGGKVACFGNNEYGQLGAFNVGNGPFVVPELKDVVSIASGGDFNCAADKNGAVWCWGNNRKKNNTQTGKLGTTGIDQTEVPTLVNGVSNAIKVAIGHNMACALSSAGTVQCWGYNRNGRLGDGQSTGNNQPPTEVSGLSGITDIAPGAGGGCARRNDNTIWCWGRYGRGNLGTCCGPQAMQVQNMSDAIAVAAETGYGRNGPRCGLRQNGEVACWGPASHGQLGGGFAFRSDFQSPVTVSLSGTATAVAGYVNGGCALMSDKTIQCWGRNESGQVGDGTTFEHASPGVVTGINDATMIAAGGRGACAIVTGGSVKCWGDYGLSSSTTPQAIPSF